MSKIKKIHIPSEVIILIVTIIVAVFFALTTENFGSLSNLTGLLKQTAVTGLIALAYSVLFIAGQFDLSTGRIAGTSAMIVAILMSWKGWSIPAACAMAMLAGLVIGLINGALVYELKMVPFIATLGMDQVLKGIIKYMCGAQTVGDLPDAFNNFALKSFLGINILVYCWLAVAIILYIMMKHTVVGRNLYTCGSSMEVAKLSGISPRIYTYLPYVLSGIICAFAGILMTTRLNSAVPSGGTGFETTGIASAVVGGVAMSGATGSPLGAVIGAILIMTIQNGGTHLGINPYFLESTQGLLVIVAIFVNQLSTGVYKKK